MCPPGMDAKFSTPSCQQTYVLLILFSRFGASHGGGTQPISINLTFTYDLWSKTVWWMDLWHEVPHLLHERVGDMEEHVAGTHRLNIFFPKKGDCCNVRLPHAVVTACPGWENTTAGKENETKKRGAARCLHARYSSKHSSSEAFDPGTPTSIQMRVTRDVDGNDPGRILNFRSSVRRESPCLQGFVAWFRVNNAFQF